MSYAVIPVTYYIGKPYRPDGDGGLRALQRSTYSFGGKTIQIEESLWHDAVKLNKKGHAPNRAELDDAVESHIFGLSQPAPHPQIATETFLKAIGFRAGETTHPGIVLTRGTGPYGRAISFFMKPGIELKHGLKAAALEPLGSRVLLPGQQLVHVQDTVNHELVDIGAVYAMFYELLPEPVRIFVAQVAQRARLKGLGVWAPGVDQSMTGAAILSLSSVTDDHVIMPKLFRRVAAYYKWLVKKEILRGVPRAEAERLLTEPLSAERFTKFLRQKRDKLMVAGEDFALGPKPRLYTLLDVLEIRDAFIKLLVPPERLVYLETGGPSRRPPAIDRG